ncbi:hypothetical protein F5887DRAFT_915998 [Amanita rubescens]|nr:hypothetical protein F5887DRAFT_915998 [Amanita rubescens]
MAAAPFPSIKPPNVAPILGALYLGVVGAAMLDHLHRLYGTTNVQIYFYIRKYREDRTWLKCAVAFLWLLDTLHMVFIVTDIWHYLIESFGNYEALLPINWVFQVLTILVVETLYARRIWKLSSQKAQFWRYIIVAACMCGYGASITLLVKSFCCRTLPSNFPVDANAWNAPQNESYGVAHHALCTYFRSIDQFVLTCCLDLFLHYA